MPEKPSLYYRVKIIIFKRRDMEGVNKERGEWIMKKLIIVMISVSFFLMPAMAGAQAGNETAGPLPVKQTLIPEGFFAIKLADALKLGSPKTEAEAETSLTSLAIAPKNGWIADYPVTPDVLIELQNAVGTAADSGKLAMKRDEATKAVQDVASELGLPVVTAGGQGDQTTSADSYGQYSNPSEISNYYSDEGPPVVTYYPPPPDYYYLYAWVPSPFWCTGYFFPGFFVLNDFDIIVVLDHHGHHHHHHHHHVITNHITNPKTHQVARIDPVTRTIGRTVRLATNPTQRGFNTDQARSSASAIFNRSIERARTANVSSGVVPRTNGPVAPSATERRMGRTGTNPETGFSSRQQGPGNHETPPGNQTSPDRSFSPPSSSGRDSFTSRSSEGSHGADSSSSGGFGGYRGGGGSFGGGFAGRGFGGGGCRGRC
jgi:uncharacterized membrane protein YgcG